MTELKSWFEELGINNIYTFKDHEFAVVKGFKLTRYFDKDLYTVQDTRLNDFYNEVSKPDMEILLNNGFLKGVDIIGYKRNVKRVNRYLRLIESLYGKRAKYNKSLEKNKSFYGKRIRNCNENIHKYHDMMQFYQSKVEQFERQNNNN